MLILNHAYHIHTAPHNFMSALLLLSSTTIRSFLILWIRKDTEKYMCLFTNTYILRDPITLFGVFCGGLINCAFGYTIGILNDSFVPIMIAIEVAYIMTR